MSVKDIALLPTTRKTQVNHSFLRLLPPNIKYRY